MAQPQALDAASFVLTAVQGWLYELLIHTLVPVTASATYVMRVSGPEDSPLRFQSYHG
jgi:hypothetical protein